ncbi:type VII secretion integral membrane protein EccD [Kineosporia sp. NBRC 101731]|uniref:type VII secretion integral membrane protein EccD n=1 Tax=Kineosporia sp. NBRC 101731 TaxID=3032199 RepID=UPI0024A27F98|nr:type VII secretion integral membrane protein EccD [Kineosporia sp. NBRC 101731]GLY31527.1 hypothetical protein Kisp02_48920 [Kineosporia sp. NBRC 101731]
MSTDHLCRVTIVGPDRQVDLAVPLALPLGGLLPSLVQHVTSPDARDARDARAADEGWILQRLGESPMSVGDTPEELNWREGDRLYLRRADEVLPSMVFDDLADGMATVVGTSPGRWQAEYNAPLFQAVAVVLIGLLGRLLLDDRMEGTTPFLAPIAAVLLLSVSVALIQRPAPGPVIIATTASGLAAAIAAGTAVAGTTHGIAELTSFQAGPWMAGGAALSVVGAVLTFAHRRVDSRNPLFPALAQILVGLVLLLAVSADQFWFMTAVQAAGTVAVFTALTLAYAARIAIRLSGVRVPQLPRKAAELQYDITPMSSPEMIRRTFVADQTLIAGFVAAALLLAGSVPVLISGGDGFAYALGALVVLAMFVRAGATRGVWARLALVAGGMWASAALVLWLPGRIGDSWLVVVVVALMVVTVPVGAAVLRPAGRRMTPIWGYLHQWLELLTALATIPLLAQLFDLYGWASGLSG